MCGSSAEKRLQSAGGEWRCFGMKLRVIFSGLFGLFLALSAFAANQAADPLAPAKLMGASKKHAPKKTDTYPMAGEVSDYSENSLEIRGEDGFSEHKYVITPQTQYVGRGTSPASYRDLRKHRWVGLLLRHTPSGIDQVVKIDFTAKKPMKKRA